jgi:hypothetical protein
MASGEITPGTWHVTRSSIGWLAAADAYTRYELLAPGSGKFPIPYEVTATTAGAVVYDNPIRPGSAAGASGGVGAALSAVA